MQATHRSDKAPKWLYLVVLAWLPFSMGAILWSDFQQQTAFLNANADYRFADEDQAAPILQNWLNRNGAGGQIRLYHFYQEGCACNKAVSRHLDAFEDIPGVIVVRVNIDAQTLPFQLPATPAVLMADANNQWRYFGAYGFGKACGKTDLPLWFKPVAAREFPFPILNTIGRGCFCTTNGSLQTLE